jgi:hypothetical protein
LGFATGETLLCHDMLATIRPQADWKPIFLSSSALTIERFALQGGEAVRVIRRSP